MGARVHWLPLGEALAANVRHPTVPWTRFHGVVEGEANILAIGSAPCACHLLALALTFTIALCLPLPFEVL